MCIQPQCAVGPYCQSASHTGHPFAGEGEASASLKAEPIITSQKFHRQPRQHSFRKVNMLREADNSLEAQTCFLLYLCCIPRLQVGGQEDGLLQDKVTGLGQSRGTEGA